MRNRRVVLVPLLLLTVTLLAAGPASAASPVADQYAVAPVPQTPPGSDAEPAAVPPTATPTVVVPAQPTATAPGFTTGTAPAAAAAPAPQGKVPFTGGEIPLVALSGLILVMLGMLGLAAGRRRGAPSAA